MILMNKAVLLLLIMSFSSFLNAAEIKRCDFSFLQYGEKVSVFIGINDNNSAITAKYSIDKETPNTVAVNISNYTIRSGLTAQQYYSAADSSSPNNYNEGERYILQDMYTMALANASDQIRDVSLGFELSNIAKIKLYTLLFDKQDEDLIFLLPAVVEAYDQNDVYLGSYFNGDVLDRCQK